MEEYEDACFYEEYFWDQGFLCSNCRWGGEYGCSKYPGMPGEFVRRKKKCKYYDIRINCSFYTERSYAHPLLRCLECIQSTHYWIEQPKLTLPPNFRRTNQCEYCEFCGIADILDHTLDCSKYGVITNDNDKFGNVHTEYFTCDDFEINKVYADDLKGDQFKIVRK